MTFTIPSINCCKIVRNGYAHKSSLQKVYNSRLRVVPIRSISVQCMQITTTRAKNQKISQGQHSISVSAQRRYVFIELLYLNDIHSFGSLFYFVKERTFLLSIFIIDTIHRTSWKN